ncbi:MAG: hypothetical protein WA683_22445 [Pseudolabrys sp.]
MSAIGTWQTFPMRLRMSAIGSKADITVGRVSSETHPYALLTFLIIAFVGDLTAGAARARCDRRHKIPLFGCLFNVRFTPESRHPAVRSECPISPNSGHYPKIASIFTLSYEVKPAEKGYEQTSADWHALRSQI